MSGTSPKCTFEGVYWEEIPRTSSLPMMSTSAEYFSFSEGYVNSMVSLRISDSDGHNPFLAAASTLRPNSTPVEESTDWETSVVIAEKYWQGSRDSGGGDSGGPSASRTADNVVVSPSDLYRFADDSSDDECAMQPVPTPPVLTERHETHALTPHVCTNDDASLALADTSSTILTIHGDFTFTTRAVRQLSGLDSFRARLTASREKQADDDDNNDNDAMATARGTLIVTNHNTGYTVDWQPSLSLLDIEAHLSSLYLLRSRGTPTQLQSAKHSDKLLRMTPQQALPDATRLTGAPLHASPAWVTTHHEEDDAEAADESPEPPGSTTSTLPRLDTPALRLSCSGTRAGGRLLEHSLPLLPVNAFDTAASLSSRRPRKATSMPLLPSLLPTPPSLAAQPPTPKVRQSSHRTSPSPVEESGSRHSSEGTVNVALPDSLNVISSGQGTGVGNVPTPPLRTTPKVKSIVQAIELQTGARLHEFVVPRPPPLPIDSPHLRDDSKDGSGIPLPLPPRPPPLPPRATATLLTETRAPHSPWVLLDSGSDENDDGASATSAKVKALARMVEAEDADAGITLRSVSSQLHRDADAQDSPDASKKSVHSAARLRAPDGNNAEASTGGSVESPLSFPLKEGTKKKGKKSSSSRGRRSSASLSHNFPLPSTAPVSFYGFYGNSNGSSASTSFAGPADTGTSRSRRLSEGSNTAVDAGTRQPILHRAVHPALSDKALSEAVLSGQKAAPQPENGKAETRKDYVHDLVSMSGSSSGRGEASNTIEEKGCINADIHNTRSHESGEDTHQHDTGQKDQGTMRNAAMLAFPSLPIPGTTEEDQKWVTARKAPQQHASLTAREHHPSMSGAQAAGKRRDDGDTSDSAASLPRALQGRPAAAHGLTATFKKRLGTPARVPRRVPYFLGGSPEPLQANPGTAVASDLPSPLRRISRQHPLQNRHDKQPHAVPARQMEAAETPATPSDALPSLLMSRYDSLFHASSQGNNAPVELVNASTRQLKLTASESNSPPVKDSTRSDDAASMSARKLNLAAVPGDGKARRGKKEDKDSSGSSTQLGCSSAGVSFSHSGDCSSVHRNCAANGGPAVHHSPSKKQALSS